MSGAPISALAAAVRVTAAGPTSARTADHFPLAASLNAGGMAAVASGAPGGALRRPHRLLAAAAEAAGASLAERHGALRCRSASAACEHVRPVTVGPHRGTRCKKGQL